MLNPNKFGGLPQEVIEYILDTGNRISKIKFDLIEETKKLFPDDSSMVTYLPEAELLKILIQLTNSKKAIEIGVFTGLSSLCMAEGLPEDGKLYCFDISEKFTKLAKKYWSISNVDHKVSLTIGPALDSLKSIQEDESQLNSFDFAYIDADKPNYDNYYEIILKLIKSNGCIIFDNTLWSNKVVYEYTDERTRSIRELNKKLRNDERVNINMINIGDGITIVRKI